MTFGQNLQQLRRQNGLSQQQLAEQLGVSRQAVSKWELNAAKPDIDTVIQISLLFHVSIDELLTGQPFEGNANHPQPVDKTRGKSSYVTAGLILVVTGIVCLILSGFAAVWMQHLEQQVHGSWYTYATEYLWHFPVAPVVALSAICLLSGLCLLLFSFYKNHTR